MKKESRFCLILEYEGIGHCILGYPDEETAEAKPRKDDYVFWVE